MTRAMAPIILASSAELFPASVGEAVELLLELAAGCVFSSRLPFGGDPLLRPDAVRGKGSRARLEKVVCSALDVLGDLVTVSGSGQERSQDEHVEGSLQ